VAAINNISAVQPFTARVPVKAGPQPVRFQTSRVFCPADEGFGPDLRRLGFAFADAGFEFNASRSKSVARLLTMLDAIEPLKAIPWRPRTVVTPVTRAGISVISRAVRLPSCSPSALKRSAPPVSRSWKAERQKKPWHSSKAIRRGLTQVVYLWVYLLNSDMLLAPNALATPLPHWVPTTFAIGFRILMRDGSSTESNGLASASLLVMPLSW
jgi:hypothetical protein